MCCFGKREREEAAAIVAERSSEQGVAVDIVPAAREDVADQALFPDSDPIANGEENENNSDVEKESDFGPPDLVQGSPARKDKAKPKMGKPKTKQQDKGEKGDESADRAARQRNSVWVEFLHRDDERAARRQHFKKKVADRRQKFQQEG